MRSTTKLRHVRHERGLRQVDLAISSGVSLATVRLAEQGLITTTTAEKLARALGVSAHDLLRPMRKGGAR